MGLCRKKMAVAGLGLILLLAASLAVQAGVDQVDHIRIEKSKRLMLLMDGDQVVRSYHIALGRHPVGAETRKGDSRAPEGVYVIDSRKAHSDYFRSLHLDYSNAEDRIHARRLHVKPGSNIMIHGIDPYKETKARVRRCATGRPAALP